MQHCSTQPILSIHIDRRRHRGIALASAAAEGDRLSLARPGRLQSFGESLFIPECKVNMQVAHAAVEGWISRMTETAYGRLSGARGLIVLREIVSLVVRKKL